MAMKTKTRVALRGYRSVILRRRNPGCPEDWGGFNGPSGSTHFAKQVHTWGQRERWLAQGRTPRKWQGPGETREWTSAPGTAIFYLPEPILTRKFHSSLRFYLQWSLILWIEVALWGKKESLPWRIETDAKGNNLKFECSASLESFIIWPEKGTSCFWI